MAQLVPCPVFLPQLANFQGAFGPPRFPLFFSFFFETFGSIMWFEWSLISPSSLQPLFCLPFRSPLPPPPLFCFLSFFFFNIRVLKTTWARVRSSLPRTCFSFTVRLERVLIGTFMDRTSSLPSRRPAPLPAPSPLSHRLHFCHLFTVCCPFGHSCPTMVPIVSPDAHLYLPNRTPFPPPPRPSIGLGLFSSLRAFPSAPPSLCIGLL